MTCDNGDFQWFLAQFKANSHFIAERNLERQGFSTFLPQQEETQRKEGRFITRMRPLFPGYIFITLDTARGSWRTVNSTIGITRLVSLEGKPTPIPHDLVNQLMRRCDRKGRLKPEKHLNPGDDVVLTKGPFTDFVATVESLAPEKRLWVLMELMGAQTRVAVSADHVQAL